MKKVIKSIVLSIVTVAIVLAIFIGLYSGNLNNYFKNISKSLSTVVTSVKNDTPTKNSVLENSTEKKQQAEAVQKQKQKLVAEKKQEEVKKQQEVAEKKQQDLEALWQTGYNEYNSYNYTNCIKIQDQVIAQDSNFYKAYTYKGIAQCFLGNYDEGLANLNKALQINSNYDMGRYNKALGLELKGQYDDAINEYTQALQLKQYVWSYYGIASIYGRRGDINNVVKYLTTAINMDSAVKQCAKDEKDFNNVRKYDAFQKLIN